MASEHTWVTHETCNREGCCPVCDGGLSICSRCGLFEGCLTTECPGVESYFEHGEMVNRGWRDYRGGKWVGECSPHSPEHYRRKP